MVDTEKGKEQDKRATETAPNSKPDYGLLPEPDSRQPWLVCESHLSLDPSDIAGTVSEVIAELRR